VAGADLVTSLRQAGVNRGDLVALVVSPAFELGLAAGDGSWAVAGVAAEVGRADEELRPRWVLWSGQTAARLAAAGVRLATCWDIAAVHRLLFGGWRADPGLAWARLHGLATETVPAGGPLDLFGSDLFGGDEGDASDPVAPDGHLRPVAGDIQFPNGMVITPDGRTLIISESFAGRLTAFDIGADGSLSGRRVFAEGLGPDGICMDAEGAVWVGTGFSIARVADGGEVLQRVELPENRAPFALMLGGPDRRTLFICTAEWRVADGHVANLERLASGPRTGQILTLTVEVPGTGRP